MPKLARLLLAVLLLAAPLCAPVNARTLAEILSSGEVRVGVNPNYSPAAQYDEKNDLVGFDVDISKQIAAMLGVKLTLVVVDPASRIPFLAGNKIDYVMAGMSRTPERAKVIDFTVPVNTEAFGLVTTESSGFTSLAAMNNEAVTFAEARGTTPVPWIQANLPKAKLLLLGGWPEVYQALKDGRATAIIKDAAAMEIELKRMPGVPWKVIPGGFGPIAYDCMGVAKDNDTLRLWLNNALFKLATDGTVDDTWRKWYGAEMVVKIVPNPYF